MLFDKAKNWIPAYAGITSKGKNLDSSFRWNDGRDESRPYVMPPNPGSRQPWPASQEQGKIIR
jgi:hypothetical protein